MPTDPESIGRDGLPGKGPTRWPSEMFCVQKRPVLEYPSRPPQTLTPDIRKMYYNFI